MTYYSSVIDERSNMSWFFRRKKIEVHQEQQEVQIQAMHHATLKKIDVASNKIGAATEKTRKLNELIEGEPGGITELIFAATGGDHRNKK